MWACAVADEDNHILSASPSSSLVSFLLCFFSFSSLFSLLFCLFFTYSFPFVSSLFPFFPTSSLLVTFPESSDTHTHTHTQGGTWSLTLTLLSSSLFFKQVIFCLKKHLVERLNCVSLLSCCDCIKTEFCCRCEAAMATSRCIMKLLHSAKKNETITCLLKLLESLC